MKKTVISTICTLSLMFSPLAQAAKDGISTSGGGNSAEYRMIEGYTVKAIASDARFKGALEILSNLEKRSPFLARTLRANLMRLTWYIVPRELESLPQYKTGLSFNTDQTAFQRYGEVFIDQSKLEPMVRLNNHSDLIIHELLMAEVIKQKGNADSEDHARVRKMTNAILNGVSGDHLNAVIQENGFTKSATDDVWNYILIESAPGTVNKKGTGVIVARKGARFLIYNCDSSALESIRENQIQSDMLVTPNFPMLASEALRKPGCVLATQTMYTITADFQKGATEYLENKVRRNGEKVSVTTVAIVMGTILAILIKTYDPNSIGISGSIAGFIFGLLPAVIIGAPAGLVAEVITGINQQKMMDALSMAGTVDSTVVKLPKNPEEASRDFIKGLDQLAERGLILKTNVSAKKK